jgi:hypothetical protein
MSPVGLGTKTQSTGEGHQEFISQTINQSFAVRELLGFSRCELLLQEAGS